MLFVAGVSIWSDHMQIELLNRVAVNGVGSVPEQELHANDERVQMWALAYLGAFVMFLVFFLLWEYRAYKNLPALDAREMRFSPGGSVGWYFCPIANLWKPFQAMSDIWQGSDSRTIRNGGAISGELIGMWWTLFVVRSIFSRVVVQLTKRAESIEDYTTATWMSIVDSGLMIAFILLTIAIVSLISSRQHHRKTVLDSAGQEANPYRNAV